MELLLVTHPFPGAEDARRLAAGARDNRPDGAEEKKDGKVKK
jgi:hypothetical protein